MFSLPPIKSSDLVEVDGELYMVKGTELTTDGPILELLPIKSQSVFIHASEVKLADRHETRRRIKSIGMKSVPNTIIHRQEGLTREQVKSILDEFANQLLAAID